MERRVVITGASAITPIGKTEEDIVANLLGGVSGVAPMRPDDLLTPHIHCRVFGTVNYDIPFEFERRYRKTMGPVSFYACQVAKEALEMSGLGKDVVTSGRTGIAFGSTHGSPTVARDIYRVFLSGSKSEFANIGAVDYLKSMVHTTAANIAKMFGITGRIISSCTACTTSSQSIGYGYEAIKFGLQDAMVCGGADEYDITTVAVFDNLLACSNAFNDSPQKTPRPFDKDRDGLVVGEGAGAVVLEEYESAKKRGANILGEVAGFCCNNNGGDFILPNTNGIIQTIRNGLETAGIGPEDVDLVTAHATATTMGDIIEAKAIHAVYGDKPHVTALKSYMGHTMGTCGVIETIIALHMMKRQVIFPTLNLDDIDERCSMIRHVQQLREVPLSVAAVQNFAFGGVNTNLVLKRM